MAHVGQSPHRFPGSPEYHYPQICYVNLDWIRKCLKVFVLKSHKRVLVLTSWYGTRHRLIIFSRDSQKKATRAFWEVTPYLEPPGSAYMVLLFGLWANVRLMVSGDDVYGDTGGDHYCNIVDGSTKGAAKYKTAPMAKTWSARNTYNAKTRDPLPPVSEDTLLPLWWCEWHSASISLVWWQFLWRRCSLWVWMWCKDQGF